MSFDSTNHAIRYARRLRFTPQHTSTSHAPFRTHIKLVKPQQWCQKCTIQGRSNDNEDKIRKTPELDALDPASLNENIDEFIKKTRDLTNGLLKKSMPTANTILSKSRKITPPPGFGGRPYKPFKKDIPILDPGLFSPTLDMDRSIYATDKSLRFLQNLPDIGKALHPLRTYDDDGNPLTIKQLRDRATRFKTFVKIKKHYHKVLKTCNGLTLEELGDDGSAIRSVYVRNIYFDARLRKLGRRNPELYLKIIAGSGVKDGKIQINSRVYDLLRNKLVNNVPYSSNNTVSYGKALDIATKRELDSIFANEDEMDAKLFRSGVAKAKGFVPDKEPDSIMDRPLEYMINNEEFDKEYRKSDFWLEALNIKEKVNELPRYDSLKFKKKLRMLSDIDVIDDVEFEKLLKELISTDRAIRNIDSSDVLASKKGRLEKKEMKQKKKLSEDQSLEEFRGPHFSNIEIDYQYGGPFVDKPQTLYEEGEETEGYVKKIEDSPSTIYLEEPEIGERSVAKNKRDWSKIMEKLPPEHRVTRNIIGIQMLPIKTQQKVFPGIFPGNHSNLFMVENAIDDLTERGLLKTIGPPDLGKELPLPQMLGRNIIEHFSVLAREQIAPFDTMLKPLLTMKTIPKKPLRWKWQSGWTRYWFNEVERVMHVEPVECPQEYAFVFDVETFYKNTQYPAIATAMTHKAWYCWISPSYFSKKPGPPLELVSFGDPDIPRVIVGYNIGYDRARVLEEYALKPSKFYFLDLMSLNMAVSGLSTQQIGYWRKRKAEDRRKIEFDTETRHYWWKHSSMGSLKASVELHLGKKVSKKTRNLMTENYMKLFDNVFFQRITDYCGRDVELTWELLTVLYPKFLAKCPDPVSTLGPLHINKAYLPVSKSWTTFIVEAEARYSSLLRSVDLQLHAIIETYATLPKEKWENDPWLRQLDWTVPIEKIILPNGKPGYQSASGRKTKTTQIPELAGKPEWYRKLYSTEERRIVVSIRAQTIPLFLKLKYDGKPVTRTRSSGWLAFLDKDSPEAKKLPIDKTTNMPFGALKFSSHPRSSLYDPVAGKDNTKWYFKIGNPDGRGGKASNLVSRAFLTFADKGRLTALFPEIFMLLREQSRASYWTSLRDRVRQQIMAWKKGEGEMSEDQKRIYRRERTKWRIGRGTRTLDVAPHAEHNKDFESPEFRHEHGVIIPQILAMGTVTRRAVERAWMTATNPDEERLASEMKTQVVAPHGYKIIGADVDSEELWLASVIGDSVYGAHGATPIGFMTLQGTKKAKTDVHSVTAGLLGIDRNDAKGFNYSRIYGSSVSHAITLLKQQDPTMSSKVAQQKAKYLYDNTKGKEINVLNPYSTVMQDDDDMTLQKMYYGGTESVMFNALEMFALVERARTPALLCEISDSLLGENLPAEDAFTTTRVNWIVQSSGVDYLHLLLVAMDYLIRRMNIEGRFLITIHDEIRYLFKEEDSDKACVALQVANIWVRAYISAKLGMYSLPLSAAYFSAIDVDHVLRKEPTYTFENHEATKAHIPGNAYTLQDTIKRLGQNCNEEYLYGAELPSAEYSRKEMGIQPPLEFQEEMEFLIDDRLHGNRNDMYSIREKIWGARYPEYKAFKERVIYRDYMREHVGLSHPSHNPKISQFGELSPSISDQLRMDPYTNVDQDLLLSGPALPNDGIYRLHDFRIRTPMSDEYFILLLKLASCKQYDEAEFFANLIEMLPTTAEITSDGQQDTLNDNQTLTAASMYIQQNCNYYHYDSIYDADAILFKINRSIRRHLYNVENKLFEQFDIKLLKKDKYHKWAEEIILMFRGIVERVAEESISSIRAGERYYIIEKENRDKVASRLIDKVLTQMFGCSDITDAVYKYPKLRQLLSISDIDTGREAQIPENTTPLYAVADIRDEILEGNPNNEEHFVGIFSNHYGPANTIEIPFYHAPEVSYDESQVFHATYKVDIDPVTHRSAEYFLYDKDGNKNISSINKIRIMVRTDIECQREKEYVWMLNHGVPLPFKPSTFSAEFDALCKTYGRSSVDDYEVNVGDIMDKESSMLKVCPHLDGNLTFSLQCVAVRLRLFLSKLEPGEKYAILNVPELPYFCNMSTTTLPVFVEQEDGTMKEEMVRTFAYSFLFSPRPSPVNTEYSHGPSNLSEYIQFMLDKHQNAAPRELEEKSMLDPDNIIKIEIRDTEKMMALATEQPLITYKLKPISSGFENWNSKHVFLALADYLTDPEYPERELILDLLPYRILMFMKHYRKIDIEENGFGPTSKGRQAQRGIASAITPPKEIGKAAIEYLTQKYINELDIFNEKRVEPKKMDNLKLQIGNKELLASEFDGANFNNDLLKLYQQHAIEFSPLIKYHEEVDPATRDTTYTDIFKITKDHRSRATTEHSTEINLFLRANHLDSNMDLTEMINAFKEQRKSSLGYFTGPRGDFFLLRSKFSPRDHVLPRTVRKLATANPIEEPAFNTDDLLYPRCSRKVSL